MNALLEIVSGLIGSVAENWAKGLLAKDPSKDYRNGPIYKKNLQRLIEYHRRPEDAEDDPRS